MRYILLDADRINIYDKIRLLKVLGGNVDDVKRTRVCQLEGGLKARPLDFTGFEGSKN